MTTGLIATASGRFAVCAELERTTILIADRHDLTRRGLVGLFRDERADWQVSEAVSIGDVRTRAQLATIIIVDLNLPGLDGNSGLRQLQADHQGCALVVLSDVDDRETVLACLAAGAQGYILKTATCAQVLRAIDTVLEGGIHAPASLRVAPAPDRRLHTGIGVAITQLTDRQRDVFRLLQEGCNTKTIARRLDLAIGTVKVHLAAIYRVLGASGRLEALAIVHRATVQAIA